MVLSINPIVKKSGASMEIDLRIPVKNITYTGVLDGDDMFVIGSIKNLDGEKFLLNLTLKCDIVIPCDRCLAPATWNIEKFVCEELMLEGTDNPDGLDTLSADSGLPILDVVSNYIITEMPMKMLCNEACKGLCPSCGINLNNATCNCTKKDIDSRLTSLNDFFK